MMNCGLLFPLASISGTFPAHEMAHALGPQKCIALPFVHTFSGCDTVSCFAKHENKAMWNVSESFDGITPVLSALAVKPDAISSIYVTSSASAIA